jgi:spore germination protein BC
MLLLLSGCWDVSSPEHLLVPTLLAVDWQQDRYRVTVASVAPALLSVGASAGGSSGGSSETPPVWVLSGEGRTLTAALRQAGLEFPEPIALAHLEVLVLGRDALAPRPLAGLLDALLRTPFLVRTFWVFATPGPAARIAEAANPIGLHPAQVLIRAGERATRNGEVPLTRFSSWAEALQDPTATVLLPIVEVVRAKTPGVGDDYRFPGSYLLRREELVGTLDHAATVLYRIMAPRPSEVNPVQPVITFSDTGARYLFTLTAYRTHLSPSPAGVRVETRVTARLDEAGGLTGVPLRLPPLPEEALAKRLARVLAAKEQVFYAGTEGAGLDVLALGRIAAATHPHWFRAEAAHWPKTLAALPFRITVRARVESTGNLSSR